MTPALLMAILCGLAIVAAIWVATEGLRDDWRAHRDRMDTINRRLGIPPDGA